MKVTLAIVALFATAQAVNLNKDAYEESERFPWGSPYSTAEIASTNQEVQAAWKIIEQRKVDAEYEEL